MSSSERIQQQELTQMSGLACKMVHNWQLKLKLISIINYNPKTLDLKFRLTIHTNMSNQAVTLSLVDPQRYSSRNQVHQFCPKVTIVMLQR